jgi:hypothetical protein
MTVVPPFVIAVAEYVEGKCGPFYMGKSAGAPL